MSENARIFQFTGRHVSTKANELENMNPRGCIKDSFGQRPQTKITERGVRTVLGTLTNIPQELLTVPPKQSFSKDHDLNEVQQCDNLLSTHSNFEQTSQYSVNQDHEITDLVDLSCNEMDTSFDCDEQQSRVRHCSSSEDTHDLPILLDAPSSGETSLDACDIEEDDDELKERVDKLLSMSEYNDEIHHYLRRAELAHRPKSNYMRRQSDITSNMRSILVDWLVEVADEYKLQRETLFLAVDYIDRFLSVMAVQRQKLQLVGAAAMFIAAKYEEIYPPEVGEFVYITDDTYTKQQVLRMESLILKVLSFDVAVPTVHLFSERFLKEFKTDAKVNSLVMYLTELSLIDGDTFLQYLPSITSCAAICLARYTVGEQDPWPYYMVDVTQYKMMDFENCMRDLLSAFVNAPSHSQQAIQEKYRQSKYHEVSTLKPPQSLPLQNC